MSPSLKGERNPAKRPEVRAKISAAKKGHLVTQDTRDKISRANKGRPSCWIGRVHTEESRKKIGDKSRGRTHTEEVRQKISNALKEHYKMQKSPLIGRKHTEESIKKMRDAQRGHKNHNFGKHMSEESKQKLSQTKKERCKGSDNPNWRGGLSFEPYCIKFNEGFKERVRAFFGYTCQLCGHVWQPGERRLAVHHVNYNKDSCCDPTVPRLFVPVCSVKCHGKTNRNRDYWERYFTELIMNKYKGQCYIPNDSLNGDDGIS